MLDFFPAVRLFLALKRCHFDMVLAERTLRRQELKDRDLKIDADAWSVAQELCK